MKKLFTLLAISLFGLSCFAQWKYPPTKEVVAKDTYFGVTYQDPAQL